MNFIFIVGSTAGPARQVWYEKFVIKLTPGRGLGPRAKLEGAGRAEDGLPAFVGPSVEPSHGHPCPPGPGVMVVPARDTTGREPASLGTIHELARPYN